MIGYFIRKYIITIETNNYYLFENIDNNINKDFATYITHNFRIINICDINNNPIKLDKFKYGIIRDYANSKHFLNPDIIIGKIYNNIYTIEFYKSYERAINKYIDENRENVIYKNNLCGLIKLYYDNGNIKEIYYQNNGKLEGKYQKFFLNGKIEIEKKFIDGNVISLTIYYDNGNIKIKKNFINNKLNDMCEEFYYDGKYKNIIFYKDDKIIRYESYDTNNKLKLLFITKC